MNKLRMRFRKEGRAIYISHLDLMHTMQRVFTRTGYQLKHSEGFNPHPIMSILLPLSVGASSCCEIMDFLLMGEDDFSPAQLEEMRCRLNSSLPEGIYIEEVYPVTEKAADLKWLKVQGRFEYDGKCEETEAISEAITDGQVAWNSVAENLRKFFSQEHIIIKKKTKSGINDFDVKSGIRSIKFTSEEDHITVDAIISAQQPALNPELLAEALRQLASELAPDYTAFSRIKIYDRGMNIFR